MVPTYQQHFFCWFLLSFLLQVFRWRGDWKVAGEGLLGCRLEKGSAQGEVQQVSGLTKQRVTNVLPFRTLPDQGFSTTKSYLTEEIDQMIFETFGFMLFFLNQKQQQHQYHQKQFLGFHLVSFDSVWRFWRNQRRWRWWNWKNFQRWRCVSGLACRYWQRLCWTFLVVGCCWVNKSLWKWSFHGSFYMNYFSFIKMLWYIWISLGRKKEWMMVYLTPAFPYCL